MFGSAVSEAGRTRHWVHLLLGYGLAVAAVWFTSHVLGVGLGQLIHQPVTASMAAILASLGLMLMHTLCNREAFVLLCDSLNSGVGATQLRQLWGRSLLTKYVPGGIWQLVGRAMLLRRHNALPPSAYYSGLLEQALSLGLCLSIAACGYLEVVGQRLAAIGTASLATTTLVLACRFLPGIHDRVRFGWASLLYAAAMPFYLAAYACIASVIPLDELSARLFAGTSAGMLIFVVPGGLGVRESVASLASSDQGVGMLTAMVLVRFLTICIETCVSLVSWMRKAKP